MSESDFNELIHAPMRFRICGLLNQVDQLDFAVLRETLNVSDATLSKHLKVLADAGYVVTSKVSSPQRKDSRRLTWVSLSKSGRKAFSLHMQALLALTGMD